MANSVKDRDIQMKLILHFAVLAAFASLAPTTRADEPLRQTTITIYAAGKPVAGLMLPIGSKGKLSVSANRIDDNGDTGAHFNGNVQGTLALPAEQGLVIYGEDIELKSDKISPEHAKAVRDLEAMAVSDQLYRGRSPTGDLSAEEWKKQSEIDVANMKRLAEIIGSHGWPGLRFAGAASQTAFMVLQHADHDSQRKYLPLVRDAVKRHEAVGSELAMIEDRVRVADGKPQLYGTQLVGKPLDFAPIEDEAHVDERRRSVGLPPMAEYANMFGLTYAPKTGARP
jgi:hypothetical protein